MKRVKSLKTELESLSSFLTMIEAYEEISALRMRKVKKTILERREFMQGLNEAFGYISYAYNIYRKSLKTGAKKEVLNTNGKTISVLLSSNTGLYGDIVKWTFDLFWSDISKSNTDILVVGKVGQKLFEKISSGRDYKYIEMPDSGVNDASIKDLLGYVVSYTNIIVYHGVFKSILSQDAVKTMVTGELMKIEESLENYDNRFLFEPSVEKVAEHFEKEISSLILEQTVFESSLSKFASRMISLDKAADSLGEKIFDKSLKMKKAKHKDINSGLQASIFGGILWR